MFARVRPAVKGGQTAGVRAPVPVDDPADPRLADYLELTDPEARRHRERDVLFVAEGVTAIERLLGSGHHVRSIVVTPNALARFDGGLEQVEAPVYLVSKAVLAAAVGFDLHRGAIAAADRRPLPSIIEAVSGARRIAVLEGLNDPENLGAIARSARAFGRRRARARSDLHRPVLPTHRPRQHGRGPATCRWPGRRAGPTTSSVLAEAGVETWALTPDPSAEPIWSLDVPPRVGLLLGAEGPGLSPAALARADRRVRIPIAGGVDSLNVGHAAAVAFAALSRFD